MTGFKKLIEISDDEFDRIFVKGDPVADGFDTVVLERLPGKRIIKITCCDDNTKVDKARSNANLGALISALAPITIVPSHPKDAQRPVKYRNQAGTEEDEV